MQSFARGFAVLAAAVLVILGALHAQVAAPQVPVPSPPTVIFAVKTTYIGDNPPTATIDPVVVMDGATLGKPPERGRQKKPGPGFVRFTRTYYESGRTYPLLMGGVARGMLTVEKPVAAGCSATAAVKLPIMTPRGDMALAATSSERFGLHSRYRNHALPKQRVVFQKLAASYLQQNGVAEVPLASLHIDSVYATKWRANDPDSLVGNLIFKNAAGVHYVFLVATKDGDTFSVAFATHYTAKNDDDPSVTRESFVDQLDFDHDGVDEIVTMLSHGKSWEYAIYKMEDGTWQKIYQGGGC